jgi:hypothetical protein
MHVHKQAGAMLHRLIGLAVSTPEAVSVSALANEMWKLEPVGGTIRASVRGSCVTKASNYLARLRPDDEWVLVGVEERLRWVTCDGRVRRADADLVWRSGRTGEVIIDELKAGAPGVAAAREQLLRLAVGGRERWGAAFLGVRYVEMEAPARVALWVEREGELVRVSGTRWSAR